MDSGKLVLALLDKAYEKKTWHGPNLRQSLKGVTAKQAAWRPGLGRHNIWEVMLPPIDGALISAPVFAATSLQRTCPTRPGKDEWPRCPTRQRQDNPRRLS